MKTNTSKTMRIMLSRSFGMVGLLLFLFVGRAVAQQEVTIRELNTYDNLTEQSELSSHPLVGELVQMTVVLSSYPRNSGLASYIEDTDQISRIHTFVIDTNAVSLGRDGMGIQIVEGENITLIEDFDRGSILTITGRLSFFGNAAQFNLESVQDVTASVENVARYESLLSPQVVNLNEVNQEDNGVYSMNLSNYTKLVGQYVKFENVLVTAVGTSTSRVDFLMQDPTTGAQIHFYDTSLRFRNDRTLYRNGYNRRQGGDGSFEVPTVGSLINISGYLVLFNDTGGGLVSTDGQNQVFSIRDFQS